MTLPRGHNPGDGTASLDDVVLGPQVQELTAADFHETRWSEYRDRRESSASSSSGGPPVGRPEDNPEPVAEDVQVPRGESFGGSLESSLTAWSDPPDPTTYSFPSYAASDESPGHKSPGYESPSHESATYQSPSYESPGYESAGHGSVTSESASYESASYESWPYGSASSDPEVSSWPGSNDYSYDYSADNSAQERAALAPETRAHELPLSTYAAGEPEATPASDAGSPAYLGTSYPPSDHPGGYLAHGYSDPRYRSGDDETYPGMGTAPSPPAPDPDLGWPYSSYTEGQPDEPYGIATETRAHGIVAPGVYGVDPVTRAHDVSTLPAYGVDSPTRAHGVVGEGGYTVESDTTVHDVAATGGYRMDSETEVLEPQPHPYPEYLDLSAGTYLDPYPPPEAPEFADSEDDEDDPWEASSAGGGPPDSRGPSRRRGDSGGRPPGVGWKHRGLIAALTVLVLLSGVLGYAAVKWGGDLSRLDLSRLLGGGKAGPGVGLGAMNILLLGSDTRQGIGTTEYGKDTAEGGAHSDTNLLVHLSADRSAVTVVSIPRDSMVRAPRDCKDPKSTVEDGVVRQWANNFTKGGAACAIRAFEANTKVHVDHFVVVDFRGFQKMVDSLGGVDVCAPTAIHDKASQLTMAAGRHHVDGKQALGYVRVRKSLGDGSDLGRVKRQQALLASVAQEATSSKLLLRPDKLYRFLLAARSSMTMDPGLDIGAMKDIALSVKGIGPHKIQFVTVPTQRYALDPRKLQWAPGANQLWAALRDDAPIPSSQTAKARAQTAAPSTGAAKLTVSPSKVTIRLVNDTGVTGLARQAAGALTVQGFRIDSWVTGQTGSSTGVQVRYGQSQAAAAKTVAAAFPGSKLVSSPALGALVEVHLGRGASSVTEVPNRLGTEPLPKPSISAPPAPKDSPAAPEASPAAPKASASASTSALPTRLADQDICG